MNIMQYKIDLPLDYNMDIIRARVVRSGGMTDTYQGLRLKAYLIADRDTEKCYAPLYVWDTAKAMNTFIFDGPFQNIIKSFGPKPIQSCTPIDIELKTETHRATALVVNTYKLDHFPLARPSLTNSDNHDFGHLLYVDCNSWTVYECHFYKHLADCNFDYDDCYEVLHVSTPIKL